MNSETQISMNLLNDYMMAYLDGDTFTAQVIGEQLTARFKSGLIHIIDAKIVYDALHEEIQ